MGAVLRGENPVWPDEANPELIDVFLQRSEYHGVQALLYERLHGLPGWPQTLLAALHRQAIAGTMWELRHQQVIAEILVALAGIGIHPVLFKGTALAYSLYDSPALRTRGDTDLIIPLHERERVLDVLASLGFARVLELGELMSYQACLTREAPGGGEHTLDLHWKINNSELLSRLFHYDELRQGSRAIAGTVTRGACSGAGTCAADCMHASFGAQAGPLLCRGRCVLQWRPPDLVGRH